MINIIFYIDDVFLKSYLNRFAQSTCRVAKIVTINFPSICLLYLLVICIKFGGLIFCLINIAVYKYNLYSSRDSAKENINFLVKYHRSTVPFSNTKPHKYKKMSFNILKEYLETNKRHFTGIMKLVGNIQRWNRWKAFWTSNCTYKRCTRLR